VNAFRLDASQLCGPTPSPRLIKITSPFTSTTAMDIYFPNSIALALTKVLNSLAPVKVI